MIGTTAAFVLYSGSNSAFDTHREALDRLGECRHVGTDPGMAALQDIALLSRTQFFLVWMYVVWGRGPLPP